MLVIVGVRVIVGVEDGVGDVVAVAVAVGGTCVWVAVAVTVGV